ncbi:aryl-alcohol dehydrogenase [NADP+] [Auricularia subglabra TFB-10046 SS5]|nr:aryl-alcohol dehydrogenase [NADP+] [Auricularia subglabra TFB-10046 SS5]
MAKQVEENFFAGPPPPPTPLGRFRLLSRTAGVHVSPICLGAMSIGDKWHKIGFSTMDKDQSFKLLDAFFDMGGNFIDTANNYQDETSELFIGEWMEKRKNRDQIVLATKYSINYHRADADVVPAHHRVNYLGNNAKSMHISVRDSLKKLRTDYIDILYVHWWDYETSVPEMMTHLHALVEAGKVLYLGISDAPAWAVAYANTWAIDHGKTPFTIYQGAWNVMDRSFERDIIPMARHFGMALAPWNVLAGGKLRTDAEEERRLKSGELGRAFAGSDWRRNEQEKKVSQALEKVAKEVGVDSITAVAIAYLLHKTLFVFPIVGGRKVEHLKDNIKALEISLTPEQIAFIESVVPFDPGFPHNFVGDGTSNNVFYFQTAHIDRLKQQEPIRPAKK